MDLTVCQVAAWIGSPGPLHSNGIAGITDMVCPVFRQISIVSRSSEYSIYAKYVFVDWAGDLFAVHLTKK